MLESLSARAPGDRSGGFFVSGPAGTTVTTTPPPTGTRRVTLTRLLIAAPDATVHGDPHVPVIDVVADARQAGDGALFFCVRGEQRDGHEFAADAVARGATALVVERLVDLPVVQVAVPSVRAAMGPISAAFFGQPSDHLSVVGVTGTNGKTTTTYLLESIARAAGRSAGIIGTTGVRIAGQHVPFPRTTPEAPDLQRLLDRMVGAGVEVAAMEVSSHGLDQRRVDGTRFACSIFTNLSRDHLDYHHTLEDYFAAKARLFTPELSERAAVNGDSTDGRRLAADAHISVTTFGLEWTSTSAGPYDVVATNVDVSSSGCSFDVDGRSFHSPLRGRFNVYNCLGALVAARLVGIEDDAIALGLHSLSGVPGRLEPVDIGQPTLDRLGRDAGL